MFRRLTSALVLASLFCFAPLARAQQAAPKIVSANMQKVFADSQERKDLEARLKTRGQAAQADQQAAQTKLRDLQSKRDQYRPGSPEYEKAQSDFSRAAVEAQVASTVTQAELIREQKKATRQIVDKMVAAVQALATERGYTLVLVQNLPPELPEDQMERMTIEQLNQYLGVRTILYVAPEADITGEVVARLDAAYKSQK